MKTRLILFLTILTIGSVDAQILYKNTYEKYQVSRRKFIFGIPTPDPKNNNAKFLASLDIENMIKQYWTYKERYEIIPYDEAIKKAKKEKDKAVIGQFITRENSSNGRRVNEFRILIPKGLTTYVLRIYMENELSKADIVYSLMVSQFLLKNHAKFKKPYIWKESPLYYGKYMKTKTLLIDKNDLGAITQDEIKANFPYKFKIVDKSEIEDAILNKDENSLIIYYGKILFEDGNSKPLKIIYSPFNGAIVSYATSKFSVGSVGLRNNLVVKDFKEFLKYADLYKNHK